MDSIEFYNVKNIKRNQYLFGRNYFQLEYLFP